MSKQDAQSLYGRRLSLAGIDAERMSEKQLRALLRDILQKRIHGISFSPYLSGQAPGTKIGEAQIRERLQIVQPHTRWVRSFSCTDGLEAIPRVAHEYGLKTLVGAWIDADEDRNEQEITAAIDLAKAGHADILAIGNEVLLREEMGEDQLIELLRRVRREVPDIPIGYVDAYFLFNDHPRVSEACDVILANCYPFWEGCAAEYSLLYMKEMYSRALAAANGKPVIVSETGWPNIGSPFGAAMPSEINAMRYFVNTYQWAEQDEIEIFYFSSFDEDWKVGDEGDVGAYWGLWDSDGRLKYA